MIANPFMPKLMQRGLRPVSELGASKPHGARLRYMAGCKCFKCRRSNSDYERQRQAARAAGDWNGIVDATPARKHMMKLSRAGVGRRAIGAATDIADSILLGIKSGRRRRARARTVRKILAVTPIARSDHSIISAAKAWRLIDQLLEEGYTKTRIAAELGYSAKALQLNRRKITARNELRIIAVHKRLTT